MLEGGDMGLVQQPLPFPVAECYPTFILRDEAAAWESTSALPLARLQAIIAATSAAAAYARTSLSPASRSLWSTSSSAY